MEDGALLVTNGGICDDSFLVRLVAKFVDISQDCLAEVQMASVNEGSREGE